ncbi:family 10 glycosylhydrolase [Nonomuraea sp. NPDC050643]|uniref:family 10 glycosylhydrolase n=1 Tax=Nonomuraea sp. NPDC050643 TaxID=3155660 RepID=UPI00340B2BEE
MRTSDWPRTATRWTQLTLAEDDPAHLDVDFWTEVMRDSRSNAACISAGGYIAYYPTRIPFHHRSVHLGDTDPFGALTEAARGLGMHVMARVDPHAVHADAAQAHPEWLACDPEGAPIEHWAHPGIWLTCAFTGYHREFITEVAREIVRDYDVDAIFANRWEGYGGISYSEAARRSFHDDTGFELPKGEHDPAWPAYVAWRRRRLSELVAIWDAAVKDLRPHARFIPNLGAFAARDLEPELVRRVYPMFVVDKQGRSGIEAPWAAGRVAKRSRGLFPDRPIGLITSVGPEHHQHRWKDSVAPPEEVRTWIVDGFAQGAFPWFTKFNATVSDPRWVPAVVEAFGLHARLEPVLSAMPVCAEVALLDPTRAGQLRTGAAHTFPDEDGFYQALVEARIPFELLADQVLSAERLRPYKVLVLADAEQLSDAQCQVIREYVAAGGGLVAAHQSSLYDEHGDPRENFGLADVFGAELREPVRGPVKNNYIALTGEHPVSGGFGGAKRIIGGTRVLRVEARQGADVPFRFVPDFPDLPMEELYARQAPDAPAVITREGPGRVVYIPFDLGAVFWEALQADHGLLIANAVRWALGGEPEATVRGPGLADLAVRKDEHGVTVTVVNLTNPMAMRGAIRETLPLPPQTVSVALPPGVRGATARLLVADAEAATAVRDGRAEVELTGAGLIEVVHLTWARS